MHGGVNMKVEIKGYGKSKQGNFKVIDTIGIPHTYCITPEHLLPDEMYLDIPKAEIENNAVCDICKNLVKEGKQNKILTYEEHEKALLVECKIKLNQGEENKELKKYLLSIKVKAEKKGFVGFAFLDSRGVKT